MNLFITLIALLSFTLPVMAEPEAIKHERPNILFIMVDDLGKEWISCYGADEIETPHIDALAKSGMLFKNAYSMPQCTPSRATLLTGKYPWRNGYVNHWDVPRWGVGYFDWKKKENTTFARLLREAGYTTFAAGKWQLNDFRLEPQAMRKHGFDEWAMWTGHESGNKASSKRYQDAYINTPEGSRTHTGKFGPDIYTEHLIRFMEKNRDKSMCLYFPMALTHSPLVPTPDEPEAKGAKSRHKAMVRYTDKIVGQLMAALDRLELRQKTIVIFTSDNGSTKSITGSRNGKVVKGAKGVKSEAGVCNPFIVSCPGLVPSGTETEALTDFTDLLPTFLDLAGAEAPEGLVIDGSSFAPVILGKTQESQRQWIMALGHGPAKLDEAGVRGKKDFATRVIRNQRFKVWVGNDRKIDRLHDLKADPLESKNLIISQAPEHTEAVKFFQAIIDTMPANDARPLYEPREANAWDKGGE